MLRFQEKPQWLLWGLVQGRVRLIKSKNVWLKVKKFASSAKRNLKKFSNLSDMKKEEIKRRRKIVKDYLAHNLAYNNRKECFDSAMSRGAVEVARVLMPLMEKSKAVVDVLSPSFDSIIEKSVQNPDMKESRLFLMYLRLSESQSFEESKRLKSRINVLELALIGYASDREL